MKELKPVIKVIGVGGGGCNAISFMSYSEINGVSFLAANTDAQDLESLDNVQNKLQLGKKLTQGLGAGADPKIGKKAVEEDEEGIINYLDGADLLFISAGMGGGTGTGAAPVIAEIAKKMGLLVIAIVTKPFEFERESRMKKAMIGIEELKNHVDALIVIPNEKIKENVDPKTPLTKVFELVDQVLYNSIQGISDIVIKPGLINIDFNDLKTIIKDAGNAMIGIGKCDGEDRATKAALLAISCPFLEEKNLSNAQRVIVNVTLDVDGSLEDFDNVGKVIKEITADCAEVIMGTSIDEKETGQITVTIIATDFSVKNNIKKINSKKDDKILDIPSFLKNNTNKIKTYNQVEKEEPVNEKGDKIERNSEKNKNDENTIPAFLIKKSI